MDALLYASLSRQSLSETLGGSNFTFPDFVAGGSAQIGLRFSHRRDGQEMTRELDVVDAYAAVGSLDARPSLGTTKIKLGTETSVAGENVTAEIPVASLTAAGILAALSALSEVGEGGTYPTPEVADDNGSVTIIFPGVETAVPISLVDNELLPISLCRVVTYTVAGEIVHRLRFIVAPAAMTSDFQEIVPPAPSIVRHQAGGDFDGDERTEIQILIRPREFTGAFQVVRNSIRSTPLSRADGTAQIKAALDPLADEDGFFEVTNPLASEAWIYFRGAMDGAGHDLMTVHVARPPAPDVWLDLDFSHPEFFGLLAAKDNVEVPLHFRVLYRDELDEDVIHVADWIQNVTAKRGLHWEGLETSEGIDFLRPPADSYVPTPVGSTITGNQHLVAAFPTSLDVGANQFTFTHELDSEDGHHAIRVNATPGYKLAEGIDYRVYYLNADQFRVDLLPDGLVFGDPVVNAGDSSLFNLKGGGTAAALGFLSLTFTTAGPTSALLAHTQAIATIDDLPETLASLAARLLAVEGRLSSGSARAAVAMLSGAFAAWEPEAVEIAYPLSRRRRNSITEWPARLKELLDLRYRGKALIRGLEGSLLPAVHDAAVENLSALTPAFPALGNYAGRVFENNTGSAVTVPGRGGRPSVSVAAGGFLACNGVAWYEVEKQESRTGTNPFASSGFSESSGAPETWAVEESSYYPSQFAFELFAFSVGADLLTDKRVFHFPFAFEAALLAANTKAQIVLEVRFGQRASAITPGTPGENLEEIEWRDPFLVHRIDLGAQPSAHVFGVRVERTADATDVRGYSLACEVEKYGTASVAAPPLAAEFWVQARLLNFDTVDAPASPEGVLCVSGLTLPAGYAVAVPAEGSVGIATVSA